MSADPEVTVTTYVRYFIPGSFFAEEDNRPVASRDPDEALSAAPGHAFAFTFYDRVTATSRVNGREVPLSSGPVDESPRFYIDATLLTSAQVAALPGDHRTLLSNMRSNGWDPIVRCRTGNFQALSEGDVLLSTAPSPVTTTASQVSPPALPSP